MKKVFLILICALCILWNHQSFAEIASGVEGNILWSISDDHELIISGSGPVATYEKSGDGSQAPWYAYVNDIEKITISSGVTSLGGRAFRGLSNVTSVDIADSVTSIGNTVFENATSLNNVVIPDSVTSMGDWVFKNATSLTNVTLSNNVTSIGQEVFYKTALTSIDIPNSVTSIGNSAFSSTPLTSIDIPNSVTSIGNNAFNGTHIEELIIPDSVTSIGTHIAPIGDPDWNRWKGATSLVIGNGITEIPATAFWNMNNLKTLVLGDSLVKIGREAFRNCWSVSELVFPDSLTIFDSGAFMNGPSLTTLTATALQLQSFLDTGGRFKKNAKVICKGSGCESVINNSSYAGKVTVEYTTFERKNPDGSVAVYKNGKLIGFKHKRIYTVDEAEMLSNTQDNKFKVRYK